ncbi:hypothetical protein [Nocardia wallacei]|uniref:hypothetical protein n=1 Tax=Nocardia wallacei TaxID=480035 RepID=UPI001656ABEA|nr:hypothetical protein [Nocardia wallacei]
MLTYFIGPLALETWLLPSPSETGHDWPIAVLVGTFVLQWSLVIGISREFM